VISQIQIYALERLSERPAIGSEAQLQLKQLTFRIADNPGVGGDKPVCRYSSAEPIPENSS
jgi:hypothetical protein